ncbi:ATP-dependent DNA helicase RecG [Corynebacterium casei]|uniref:ATP-dependent DNA helicase n=3 Tax=Corynebacterium casei TaxID=160386 RepID=A0ABN4CCR3_9CORY|nr:ATP-dependent DNA helicase RecG [Corynebacterium casei]AHI20169.1 ATP-dependent DNA helicase [Corynebacterium casei LMG S-19264]MDN5800094.1 ATP-dependent DNA helicase RecG [Corynebacterium casei]MDN5922011.1 ATP-dependent DNA helicase RecG [Corynebacterium casei]MDN6285665.1 ATP-dependent DNA helicase RecG [Corynebacterium casei]MDN6312781.1 ATP-dependent DNA helicase RecG [Corynebacterium casei]
MLGWKDDRPLTEVLPGKVAKALTKSFGYSTCGQLLMNHYPRDYIRQGRDFQAFAEREAPEGSFITISGTVTNVSKRPIRNGFVLNVTVDDTYTAVYFNGVWQERVLYPGMRVLFSGKLKFFNSQAQLQHPEFLILDAPRGETSVSKRWGGTLKAISQFVDVEELLREREWLPVYRASSTLKTWTIMAAIHHVLKTLPPIQDPLDISDLTFDKAIREIHEPGPEGPQRAIDRLKYNEALGIGLVMALRRRDTRHWRAFAMPPADDGYRAEMLAKVPFDLTSGQKQVLRDIDRDISEAVPMSRLLQGEVGSGKTLVAVAAMLSAVDAGRQAALLAPTEVLAHQHARSISAMLPDDIRLTVLSGSMKTAEKRQALLDIVSGEADIVVGTHAIIQQTVEFYSLGLVVVDEQHRFGVEQRDTLRMKAPEGTFPHVLVMTATPIPRTIAMTVFGDLEVSSLHELPGGRKPIQSSVLPEAKASWVRRGWERIREEVDAGRQAYVVCPRIEGEGGVLELAEALEEGPLEGLRIMVLHGRMDDKDDRMAAFARGEVDVLISTTVIEVGVDVPNATVILIRESENFGVSQLHQLRGRVGRGGNASLCLFHTLAAPNSPSFERISKIAATSSGFELTELDMEYRREGDVLGTRQSGRQRTLQLLDLSQDLMIIERAYEDAYVLVDEDPELAFELTVEIREEEQEYLDKS